MRLIDADALYKEIDMGQKAALGLVDGSCKYGNVNSIDDCLDAIKYADVFDIESHDKAVSEKAVRNFLSDIAPELEKCWYRCELDMGADNVLGFLSEFAEERLAEAEKEGNQIRESFE